MIRLLIADDHEFVRSSIALGLQACEDIEVVGEACNGEESVELCEALQPNVVLMDLRMPKMDGITAIRKIRELLPNIRVIVLTNTLDHSLTTQAIIAGAGMCLSKGVTLEQLCRAIEGAVEK